MEFTLRAASPAERLYAFDQSTQIKGQTGYIGCLCGDVSSNGSDFTASWEDCRSDIVTDEFQAELDEVLKALRFDEKYGGVFRDYAAMTAYCNGHPESDMGRVDREFAFRVNTERYSYLMRMYLNNLEHDFEIHPYRRDWLDRHMKQAEKGIRFITPDYTEKFRVPDGDGIRIFTGRGETRDRTARYIDECHFELSGEYSSNLYHICEFAERLERSGGKVIPLRSSLPEKCFSVTSTSDEIIIITKGEIDCCSAGISAVGVTAREGASALNEAMDVTKAQEAAMLFGSIYGWDKPVADPKNYDEQGKPIKPRYRDRSDAR